MMKMHFWKTNNVALSLLAAAAVMLAPEALGQVQYNPAGAILGGVIGGAIGNQVSNRHDRVAAPATLAAIGAVIGDQAANQPAAYYRPPVAYGPAVVYSQPVVYGAPVY